MTVCTKFKTGFAGDSGQIPIFRTFSQKSIFEKFALQNLPGEFFFLFRMEAAVGMLECSKQIVAA